MKEQTDGQRGTGICFENVRVSNESAPENRMKLSRSPVCVCVLVGEGAS